MTTTASKHIYAAIYIFAFSSLSLLTASPASADKISKLDDCLVEEFITRTTEITSRQSGLSPEKIREYLEKHLHKKGFFKSEIQYNIPGFPSQINTLSLDKPQFIDSILSVQDALEDYEVDIKVNKISISRDKEKATLSTTGTERGLMPIPSENSGIEGIPVEGVSNCSQILMIEEDTIQMYSAKCSTEITFSSAY